MTKRGFGELELAILQILRGNTKMTVANVHKALGGCDKYTTIMTVMNRLVEKKQLGRERNGLRCSYWLLEAHAEMPSLINQLKKKIFGFKTTAVVSYLLDAADDVTEKELDQMQKMIEDAKLKRKMKS